MNLQDFVRNYRHIYHTEDVCKKCQGTGIICYGSTALWRDGLGGAAITPGVCDECWGSGNARRPWISHRTHEALEAHVTELEDTIRLVSKSCGFKRLNSAAQKRVEAAMEAAVARHMLAMGFKRKERDQDADA